MKKVLKSNASQTLLRMIWSNRVLHQPPCQLECILSFKYHMQNRNLSPPCLRLLDLFFLDFTSSQMIQKYAVCFNSLLSFSSRVVCCKSRSKVSSRLKKLSSGKHTWLQTLPPHDQQCSPHHINQLCTLLLALFRCHPFQAKKMNFSFPTFNIR